MMQRSIINSSILRCSRLGLKQNLRRNFNSSARVSSRSLSRWVLPSSLMAIGISTYYLTQPLQLDTKKDPKQVKKEVKEVKEDNKEESKPEHAEQASEVKEGEATEGEEPQPQAAYNPETGEINWDCPCLGGMAHGPCGEEFKEAFSCFVFSEADPKGFDCIEKFKNMQNCFRKYPDVYSEEIRDDDNSPVETNSNETSKAETPEAKKIDETDIVASTVTESIPSADIDPISTEQVTLPKGN